MARSIKEVRELDRAIKGLEKFCSGGAIRQEEGNIDKCHAEFNRDERFSMAGTHRVFYSSCVGYFGSSDCYTQIELPESCRNLFWKCFDQYLNEHQDAILHDICKRMKFALAADINVVKGEIDKLTALYNDLQG